MLHLILHLKHTQATPTSLPANRGVTVLNTATLAIPHSLNCASIAIAHANQGYKVELHTVTATTVAIVSVIVLFFQEKEHSKTGVRQRLFFPTLHVDVFISQSRLSLLHRLNKTCGELSISLLITYDIQTKSISTFNHKHTRAEKTPGFSTIKQKLQQLRESGRGRERPPERTLSQRMNFMTQCLKTTTITMHICNGLSNTLSAHKNLPT